MKLNFLSFAFALDLLFFLNIFPVEVGTILEPSHPSELPAVF